MSTLRDELWAGTARSAEDPRSGDVRRAGAPSADARSGRCVRSGRPGQAGRDGRV